MEKKINYAFIFSIIVSVAGWAVTFGVCKNKIDTNTRDIAKIEARQENTDELLRGISSQLVELNTKMTLLLNGSIKQE